MQQLQLLFVILQAAAHAAHPTAASAPPAACAKGRRATPTAVSESPQRQQSTGLVMVPECATLN